MNRKQWIWITILIALIHGLLIVILSPVSFDIVFTRFDGNPYDSPWDPWLLALYFLLNIPYLAVTYSSLPLRGFPPLYYIVWVANSLAYGLLGAWLISKLPFMKDQNLSE